MRNQLERRQHLDDDFPLDTLESSISTDSEAQNYLSSQEILQDQILELFDGLTHPDDVDYKYEIPKEYQFVKSAVFLKEIEKSFIREKALYYLANIVSVATLFGGIIIAGNLFHEPGYLFTLTLLSTFILLLIQIQFGLKKHEEMLIREKTLTFCKSGLWMDLLDSKIVNVELAEMNLIAENIILEAERRVPELVKKWRGTSLREKLKQKNES